MTKSDRLAAPFPWFGGKSQVADIVWSRFGVVANYVEPFFGSGAVILRRPAWSFGSTILRETINDFDGHVANFWRSVKYDPDAVAAGADRIVHELDLHAIGDALFCRPCRRWPMPPREFVEWIRQDEMHYHAEMAGAWCWFVANWIGGLPSVNGAEHQSAVGVHRRRPTFVSRGVSRQREEPIREWMRLLSSRLSKVRCCCGDWSRVLGGSVTTDYASPCAVFFDPPYSAEAGRENAIYSTESATVAHDVREWCLANGDNLDFRIALCGYEGEHSMPDSWECVKWKTQGGYANIGKGRGRDNARRERLWFSPGCVQPGRSLF